MAIINELAARRAFGGRSPLGQRILVWGEKVPSEVVGVVGNVRHTGLDAEPRSEAWRPIGAVGWANLSLVVRGKVPPETLIGPVREAIFQRLNKREQEHDGADKGIGAFVSRYPRYHRVFGVVSISDDYHPLSRELMVSFSGEARTTMTMSTKKISDVSGW